MSLANNSYDCLKQLQQFVNQFSQSDRSSYLRNSSSSLSSVQSNDASALSLNNSLPRKQTLRSQFLNGSSVDGQISEVYPISILTRSIAQITTRSTSSTSQMQPVIQNLVPAPSTETGILPIPTNSQNRQTSHNLIKNKTPIWQTIAHIENILYQPEDLSKNPTWPNCKPTTEVEKRKKRVICECPNCSAKGGNKTYSITGRLQHKCHIPGCGRSFDWPSILKAHLRAHLNDRPFSCSWYSCQKQFKSKEELVRHIKIHTDERNFICPHCNLGFQRSDHLAMHIRKVHENPKVQRSKNSRKRK